MTVSVPRARVSRRARSANQRPGSFKPGHKKLGGRKRGTPNVISADYRKALFEAACRVGQDGNGKGGIVGYFRWVAVRHPRAYAIALLANLPVSVVAEGGPTPAENERAVREFIGFGSKRRTKRQANPGGVEPFGWTGQGAPVGPLMNTAVTDPQAFCGLIATTFPRPTAKRHRANAGFEAASGSAGNQ